MSQLILIDPGHGGADSGCIANGRVEKEMNLAVAKDLHEAVCAVIAPELVACHLTRTGDTTLSLTERANIDAPTFVIVLHCDTSADPNAGHLRCYARSDDPIGSAVGHFISERAPKELADKRPSVTVASPADWTHRAYNVLKMHACPAVLVEMAFLSNIQHIACLTSLGGRMELVSALMAGLSMAIDMNHQKSLV